MSTTRRAWWHRARWHFLMYALVIVSAVFFDSYDLIVQGWKIALGISAGAAFVGTACTLGVVMGRGHYYLLIARLEFFGVGGIVALETFLAMYGFWLSWILHDTTLLARAATHLAFAIAVGLAYQSRPVREKRKRVLRG